MSARNTRRVAERRALLLSDESPEPFATAYRKLAEAHPGGDVVAYVVAPTDDLRTIEASFWTRETALGVCADLEAMRVLARLQKEAPPAGHFWCLLIVKGYGVALEALPFRIGINACGGDA